MQLVELFTVYYSCAEAFHFSLFFISFPSRGKHPAKHRTKGSTAKSSDYPTCFPPSHLMPTSFPKRMTSRGVGGLVWFRCASLMRSSRRAVADPRLICLRPLHNAVRAVHEGVPLDLPLPFLNGARKEKALEEARDALLQFNLMIRSGVEADNLMYTSLIDTMAKAGLEWHAYKLFSRMIEAEVRPLPETYLALLNATSHTRSKLREDIKTKLDDCIATFPAALAEEEARRMREEDAACWKAFEASFHEAPTSSVGGTTAVQPAPVASETEEDPVPPGVVHIRSPRDVWNTAAYAEQMRGEAKRRMKEAVREPLRSELAKLHEEELRIFLSVHRQLRHGRSKSELVERILETVGEEAIRGMLKRRRHYFRSVESILKHDLDALQHGPRAGDGTRPAPPTSSFSPSSLTAGEAYGVAPEILHTPWGFLRKPTRSPQASPSSSSRVPSPNEERLLRLQLTEEEMRLLWTKAVAGDLDEVPELLLRRYAYQFQLRWRRGEDSSSDRSLLQAVGWHVTTFFAADLGYNPSPAPTPHLRRERERLGMQRTLEQFEAFRVMAHRTQNLQVVDHKEINLHLHRVRRESAKAEKAQHEEARREAHRAEAAALGEAAMRFEGPSPDVLQPQPYPESSQVLGAESASTAGAAGSEPEELPPWELTGGEDEFHLDTGRFGDASVGRYRELSDSNIRLRPQHAALKQWKVDEALLPVTLKDRIAQAQQEEAQQRAAVEAEYQRRLQFRGYRKWDRLLSRSKAKKQLIKEEEAEGAVKPIPASRRLSQLLRKGREEKVSDALLKKYAPPSM